MGMCWYCHWGWPKPVADIYDKGVEMSSWSAMHFGPGHIVWEDENFDSPEWCLENFEKYKRDYSDEELEGVRWSLEELAKLPLEIRDPQPDDYDDANPAKYPPPKGMIMIGGRG